MVYPDEVIVLELVKKHKCSKAIAETIVNMYDRNGERKLLNKLIEYNRMSSVYQNN